MPRVRYKSDKLYRESHREEIRRYARAWKQRNREKVRAQAAAYRERNRDKIRESSQNHYAKNKERIREKARSRDSIRQAKQRQQRAVVAAIKAERGCSHCGFTDARALDFHHRDPSTKHFGVGAILNGLSNWDRVLEEINKCDVLCANCHRILHAVQRNENTCP